MDRGARQAIAHGVTKNQTRWKWLSTCELLVGAYRFYHSFPDQKSNPGPLALRAQGLSHWTTGKSLGFIYFESLKTCSSSSVTIPGLCSTAAPCGSWRQQQQRMFPGPLGLVEEVRLPFPYSGQSSWDSWSTWEALRGKEIWELLWTKQLRAEGINWEKMRWECIGPLESLMASQFIILCLKSRFRAMKQLAQSLSVSKWQRPV